jgi:hypothetical protein
MSHIDVSADLKGSQFSRFGCEPESLPVVAEDTNVAAAVEDKQSRLRAFSRPERLVQERFSRAVHSCPPCGIPVASILPRPIER